MSPPTSSPWVLALFLVGLAALLWELYRSAYKGRRTASTLPDDRHDGGSVYVLSNSGYDHLVKIGYTTRDASSRAAELSSDTGVPGDFEVEHEVAVTNPEAVEQAVHDRLATQKVNRNREFFEVTPQEARAAIDAVLRSSRSPRRRTLGGTLSGLALLVGVALVTYHPADDAVVQSMPGPEAAMHLESPASLPPAQNALGLPGAWLAHALMPEFLGALVLVPCGLLVLWGYALLRGRSLGPLLPPTSLVLFATLVAAAVLGWAGHAVQSAPVGWNGETGPPAGVARWAGAAGLDLGHWLRSALGPSGSFALLVGMAGASLSLLTALWTRTNGHG